MAKRMILMLSVTAVVLTALGFVKFRQFEARAGQAASFQPPPEAVTTIVAERVEWPTTLSAIATTAAVQGVTVSADLPGIVDRIAFDSGMPVREGDVLVELDTRQERAQLAAVEARRDLARLTFNRMQDLLNERVISRAEYDRATAEHRQSEAQVGEIRAAIDRKTIRAPFSGVLGIRQVNLGQYLAGGDAVVPLQSLHPIYVNFGVPQQDAAQVRIGRNVRITTGDLAATRDVGPVFRAGVSPELPTVAEASAFAKATADRRSLGGGRSARSPTVAQKSHASGGGKLGSISTEMVGRVTAIDAVVDEGTRNVQVQATLGNPGGRLRPGMFVQAELVLGATRSVVAVPASAVSYAPYGDSVFVVTDLQDAAGRTYRGVRQQFVKIEGARGDQIAVVSGLKPGDEVVTSGVFKLRNGAAVVVNNTVRPGNNPAPRPEDS